MFHKHILFEFEVQIIGLLYFLSRQQISYGKCSKILNTFFISVLKEIAGNQSWNSQNTCQNSK